jgi:FXSXX-COOH protein
MSDEARLYPDGETHLIIADVVDTPLEIVLLSDDSVLGHSVRRLLSEIDGMGENYAAHSNSTA